MQYYFINDIANVSKIRDFKNEIKIEKLKKNFVPNKALHLKKEHFETFHLY